MDTSSNIQLAVPFFIVADMDVALSFYKDKLGFSISNHWSPRGTIEWCWLQRDGVSIMLQQPRNKEQGNDQENGKGVSICFQCKDALALYQEFTTMSIRIKEPFVGNQMWVVSLDDPDGYHLDFESPTDVKEGTTYSEWLKTR